MEKPSRLRSLTTSPSDSKNWSLAYSTQLWTFPCTQADCYKIEPRYCQPGRLGGVGSGPLRCWTNAQTCAQWCSWPEIGRLSVAPLTEEWSGLHWCVTQGISSKSGSCETCGENLQNCNGHFGHVRLALPAFHIGYLKLTMNILQNICKVCYHYIG